MYYRSNPRSDRTATDRCLIAASELPGARVLRFPAWDTERRIRVQTPGQLPSGSIATRSRDVLVGSLQYGFESVGHSLVFGIHLAKFTHFQNS